MSTTRSKALLAGTAALAALALAACSSGSSGSASSGSASSGASSAATAAGVAYAKNALAAYQGMQDTYGTVPPVSDAPDLRGKTVWYIPLGALGILASIGTGMTQALTQAGATVHTCDGKFQPTTVATCMQEAADQNASAVVTSFVDYASIPSAFQTLARKNIPVLVGGESAPVGVKTSSKLAFFTASPLSFQLMSDEVIAESGGKANVLVGILADSPSTVANSDSGVNVLKQHCPGCTVSTINMLTADQDKFGSEFAAKLTADPDINYVILPQDPQFPFVLTGLESSGAINRVKVVTSAGGTAGLESVKAGQISADIGTGATYFGWAFADATVRLLAGSTVTPSYNLATRVFTKSSVTSLKLTDAAYNSPAWYGGTQWEKNFLSAWAGQ